MSQSSNTDKDDPNGEQHNVETERTRTMDSKPGWGLYVNVDDANEWFTLIGQIGVLKSPSQLQREDLVGKFFNSLEDAETFFTIYSRAVGFPVRKGHKRKNAEGIINNREWLCAKEGHRDHKYFNLQNRQKEPKSLTREGCEVRFRVNFFSETEKWIVREFMVEHSHDLAKATHIQFMPSNRHVSGGAVNTAKTMKSAGMRTCAIMSYFAQQVGGYDNIRFTKKDLYNRLSRTQICELTDSDAAQAIGYLQHKCDQDLAFFGKYTYDSDNRLENMLWADGKCRRDFVTFGDVLSFDTTYKTNQYGKPLLVFVGVNNHFRSTIFAFALLKNENTETYIWALRTFMECMYDRKPKTCITDGDLAMKAALAEVMPTTVHRLCSWHLEQNCLVHIKKQGFLAAFKKLLFRFYTPEQFEIEWRKTINDFSLHGNGWVESIYEKRHSWADTFLRGRFFGGMSTTQRCEKMHSFLKSKLEARITLTEFVRGMDSALTYLRHKESEDDYNTVSAKPVLGQTNMSNIEDEASTIYTRRMFFRVREEMKKEGKYIAYALEETQEAINIKLQKYGDVGKRRQVNIYKDPMEFKCGCSTLSSKGIPCRHIFAAMKTIQMTTFPISLVLKRWTMCAQSDDNVVGEGAGPWMNKLNDEKARFGHITSKCSEIAFIACRDDALFYTAIEGIDKLASMLKAMFKPTANTAAETNTEKSELNIPIQNPTNSRTKGGWTGTKRVGTGRKHCTICHMVGHNKATCLARTKKHHPADQSDDDLENHTTTTGVDACVSPTNDPFRPFAEEPDGIESTSQHVVDLEEGMPCTEPHCTNACR